MVSALSPAQRQGALKAGTKAFLIMSCSWAIIGFITLIVCAGLGFLDALGGMSTGPRPTYSFTLIDAALCIALLLCLAAIAVGFAAGLDVLVTYDIHRPKSVSWAALGIGLIPTACFAAVFVVGILLLGVMNPQGDPSWSVIVGVGFGLFLALIDLVATPFIGAYSFVWMTHHFQLNHDAA